MPSTMSGDADVIAETSANPTLNAQPRLKGMESNCSVAIMCQWSTCTPPLLGTAYQRIYSLNWAKCASRSRKGMIMTTVLPLRVEVEVPCIVRVVVAVGTTLLWNAVGASLFGNALWKALLKKNEPFEAVYLMMSIPVG